MRICPDPYVCVIPPEKWKGKVIEFPYTKKISSTIIKNSVHNKLKPFLY